MRLQFLFGCMLGVILLILAVLWWPETESEFPPNVKLYDHPPANPASVAALPIVNSVTNDAAAVIANMTEVPAVTPVFSETVLRIQDALGQPIVAGEVIIQTTMLPFRDGRIDLPQMAVGDVTVCAKASGYTAASKTVFAASPESKIITLEYITEHELSFYSDIEYRHPVAGAKVTFWKGRPAARPVLHQATVQITTYNLDTSQVMLQRDANGIRIAAGINDPLLEKVPSPDGRLIPSEGAVILGVGGAMWNPNNNPHYFPLLPGCQTAETPHLFSTPLRLWDALSLSGTDHGSFFSLDFLEWDRNGENHYVEYMLPGFQETMEPMGETLTDENGRCHFTVLSPGLYYAQAEKNGMRSFVLVLHPLRSLMKACLRDKGTLFVETLKSGFEKSPFKPVPKVEIVLKKNDTAPGGIMAAKTDDYGYATLSNLVWGTYQMTLTPPADLNLPSKTVNVTIRNPKQTEKVYFEMGYPQISGRVIEENSRKPVPNYWLELHMIAPVNNNYLKTKTNDQGEFVFANVQPGSYEIWDIFDPVKAPGYMPAASRYPYKFLSTKGHSGISSIQGYSVSMADHNVQDIELAVTPVTMTDLEGTVFDTNGKPVSEAIVTFENEELDLELLHPEQITDGQGRFSIHRYGYKDTETVHQSVLTGMAGKQIPGRWKEERGNYSTFVKGYFQPIASGTTAVSYHSGDQIKSIKIVIDKAKQWTLEGVVLDPKGKAVPIESIQEIYAEQKGVRLYAENGTNGRFVIANLDPGTIELSVLTDVYVENNPVYGIVSCMDYFSEFINLKIDENLKTPFVEIKLQKAGYLAGFLYDKQGNPIEEATLESSDPKTNVPIKAVTGSKGQFWVFGLHPDLPCSFTAITKDKREIGRWEGMLPSEKEIKLKAQY